MKKIIISLLFVITFLLVPKNVLASGGISVSPTSITLEQGSSKTFTITATNTIGDVTIASNNTGIATVNSSSWGTGMVEEGRTVSTTITVTGVNVGNTTINLGLDASTFDEEEISGTRTVSVTVVAKPTPQPSPTPTPTPSPTPTPTPSKEEQKEDKKSNNNNIKEITIDGYKLTKKDNNNYELSVKNDVEKINLKVVVEDSKSKVKGDGEHKLNIGENKIEVIITAEDGSENKIVVKVTRDEKEEKAETVLEPDDNDITPEPIKKEKKINIIEIIMISLNIILLIAVIILFIRNKKLKEENNYM